MSTLVFYFEWVFDTIEQLYFLAGKILGYLYGKCENYEEKEEEEITLY